MYSTKSVNWYFVYLFGSWVTQTIVHCVDSMLIHVNHPSTLSSHSSTLIDKNATSAYK